MWVTAHHVVSCCDPRCTRRRHDDRDSSIARTVASVHACGSPSPHAAPTAARQSDRRVEIEWAIMLISQLEAASWPEEVDDAPAGPAIA